MAINAGRVFLGGLIAGVIRLIGGRFFRAQVIGPLFFEELRRNQPEVLAAVDTTAARVEIVVINLLMGIALIYMYAAMRPRFASRFATIVSASIPAWFLATSTWGITAAMTLFTWPHVIVEACLTLITVLVAAYVGSSVYKETADARPGVAARTPAAAELAR